MISKQKKLFSQFAKKAVFAIRKNSLDKLNILLINS